MNIASNTRLLKWFIFIALLLFIVSFISFWFGGPSFSESKVELSIEGPTQASVGDEIVYKLKYSNKNKVDLKDLKFKFTYPNESVVLKDGSLTDSLEENFFIDKLSPGQSGEKEYRVFLVGDRGNIKEAQTSLSFKAGSLKTSFKKDSSISTTIVALPVALTLVAPPNAISGQSLNYLLDYRNESGQDISGLRFEFTYPDGFSITKLIPSASERNNIWNLSFLRRGEGSRITIHGVLNANEGESRNISVVLKRKIGDSYINYEKVSTSTVIADPLLGINIFVNDARDYSAHIGDELNYTMKYSNNSNFNITGLNLIVKLEGQMFDFTSLDTKGGYFDDSNQTILWNASTIADFANLAPNRKGQVDFRIRLKPRYVSDRGGSKNLFVKVSADFNSPNVPPDIGGDQISVTDSVVTKITTQPSLNQLVFYSDPAFSSFGPLPPEVGKETTFTVHWQITNPGNDMNDVKVSAILPAGVTWKDIVSVGSNQPQPTLNRNTSEVSWNLGFLPREVGINTPKYEASFQISIKPSINQEGAPVELIKNSKIFGIDSFTKQNIIVETPDVNTDDLTDRPGEGIVQ